MTTSKPLALTEDQIKALERRVVQNWQVHRGDMEALFAMARERNALVGGKPQLDESRNHALMMGHPWGSP